MLSALKCHKSLPVIIPVLGGMAQLFGCEGDSDRAAFKGSAHQVCSYSAEHVFQ